MRKRADPAFGLGDADEVEQFDGAGPRRAPGDVGLMDLDGLGDLVADRYTGVSADIGSWKTVPIAFPRIRDISLSDRPSSSSPRRRTDPETSAYSGSSPITAIAAADLPDPDSPTIATTSPAAT